MFVASVGLAAERGRIQLVRPPQPCREMGRRLWWGPAIPAGIFLPAKGAAKISKLETNDPDKIGLLTSFCYFIFGYAISGLRTGTLPIEPDNLPILGESRDILGGLGGEEDREEGREQTCCRHSHVYCYQGKLLLF